MVKLAPVAIELPPVEAAYHIGVPLVQVAPKVTVPVPQILPGVTLGGFALSLTVTFASIRGVDSHPSGDLQLT